MPRKKSDAAPVDWLLYERCAAEEGFASVCGIDEAGRGPLAGPVMAAAVIMPPGLVIDGVNDSKKLSPKKRDALFDEIREQALAFAIAAADVDEIERDNILNATFSAMRRAASELDTQPDLILVDGNRLPPGLTCAGRTIISGDALSHSIACASILAKVSRDRFMLMMDEKYPQYGFAQHKGYGTPQHIAALREFGPCPIHRLSFLGKIPGIPTL